jgi:hypothetical protein
MNAIVEKVNSWDIFPQYVKVMNDYLLHFTASEKFKQRDKDCTYLLINGLTTLTHVFKITLNHQISEASISEASISEASISEASISEAVENTEKSIYYYTQFIEQIDENKMNDLNVSSNSASLFVYKKTINHLFPAPKHTVAIIKNVEYLLLIYRSIFDILIQANYNPLIPSKLINIAIELCRNNSDEILFREEMTSVMLFINHFPHEYKILNSAMIFEHIYLYIKKFKYRIVTLEQLCNKRIQPDYALKIKEDSYIKWLFK